MSTKLLSRQSSKPRAQAMVEFAIVLPVLVMLLIGLFEVGRLVFAYAAVTNASREAVRYGSALGYDTTGYYHKFRYCDGIQATARKSAFFLDTLTGTQVNVQVRYDLGPNDPIYPDGHGPDTPAEWALLQNTSAQPWRQCDYLSLPPYSPPRGDDPNVIFQTGERVLVRVTYNYHPYTKLVPFPQRTFVAMSARTILGYVDVAQASGGGSGPGGGGGGGGGGTPAATNTAGPSPTATGTATATATFTATPLGQVDTLTPLASATITLLPPPTETATATATDTATATPTLTPTNTATAISGCGNITGDVISVSTNTMYMTFTNPYGPLTVSDVQVNWNANGSGGAALQSASLGSLFWSGTDGSGNATLTPTSTLTIPGNNTTSVIIFTFDANYTKDQNDSITINLSGDCAGYTIKNP